MRSLSASLLRRFTVSSTSRHRPVVLPALSPALSPTHWPNALGWLSGLALFFVTAVALDDEDGARRSALVVLVGSGVLCSVVVLLQAAGLGWLTSDVYTGLEFRSPGTFGNPNWAAASCAPFTTGLKNWTLGSR